MGVLPGYLYCRHIGTITEDLEAKIWEVTYDFIWLELTPEHKAALAGPTQRVFLDAGWNEKIDRPGGTSSGDQSGPKTRRITDGNDVDITAMALLDGYGKVLPEGESQKYRVFAELERISFNPLRLPSIRLDV